MTGLIDQHGNPLTIARSQEGQYRDGPWWLPISGGYLPHDVGKYWNWWQLGYDVSGVGTTAMVEACVSRYAQTIAMCPGSHWFTEPNGGRTRVTTSALSRILRKPNGYQTISDFLLNTVRSLYLEGNAYALALRNDRFEVAELHWMNPRMSWATAGETGEVFYHLAGNPVVDERIGPIKYVPARDVLHIRLHSQDDPLCGKSPLLAAAMQMSAGNAALQQQIAFLLNQARPSFVLSTDIEMERADKLEFRELWNEDSRGLNAGGTVILSHGMKPFPLSVSAAEQQLVQMMQLNDQAIANVFGIPLQIFGVGGGTPQGSTEALMRDWLAGCLGFAINHVEVAFDALFGLKGQPEEYTELDTSILLRSAEKERIGALADSIRGGIRTINEARRGEGLPAVEGGNDIRIQQQDVPLDWHDKQAPKPAAPPALPPPAQTESSEEKPDADRSREWARSLLAAADEYERRAA